MVVFMASTRPAGCHTHRRHVSAVQGSPCRARWARSWPLQQEERSANILFFFLFIYTFALVSLGSRAEASTTTIISAEKRAEPKKPLLLYIPMHVSEPIEHLQELCDLTLSKDPWIVDKSISNSNKDENADSNHKVAFDILLVVSGPSEEYRTATSRFDIMRSLLEEVTKDVLPSPPRIFLDYKTLGVDKYNLSLDNEDKDSEWVSGPNSVFYDAFSEGGEIYEKYVRQYALVQQLETDVVALRGGWLSKLLKPMLASNDGASDLSSASSPSSKNSAIIMSGSTIKSSCVYIVKFDTCQPFEEGSSHMTEHINGNALFRLGPLLQHLLKTSREQFKNAQPFDLAMHLVLKASNKTSLAHSNPLYDNVATLLDRDWFHDGRYYGLDDLAVVHAPRRLREDGLKAVATRAVTYLPATVVVLSSKATNDSALWGGKGSSSSPSSSSSSSAFLHNFKAAAAALHLSGIIYVATSEKVFFEASRVVPLQVVPAFEKQRRDGNGDEEEAAAAAASAAAAEAAGAATTVDPKSFILMWPPTSQSPSVRLLSTITQLVTQGYSPLVIDASSMPLKNFDVALSGFPKDAIYFVDTLPVVNDEARRPFHELKERKSGSTVAIETMFVPASAYTANLLQAWAVAMFRREMQQQKQQQKAPPAHLTLAEIKALAACRLDTTMSGFTPCPWRGVGVEPLPVHWFPPQAAYFGSGWTKRARKHAFFLDTSSAQGRGVLENRGSTVFRLRHAGKWHSPARCPTYSVLSRLPRDLTHETVHSEIALHAEFLSFVRENKIACAVLPGFRMPSTSATLPVDALLDLGTVQLSAGAQATVLPRVQDVEDASAGYVAFDFRGKGRERKAVEETARRTRHPRQQSSPQTTAFSPRSGDLCSRFDSTDRSSLSSFASCLSKEISRALEEARSRLPSSFVCALDHQRSVEDVALAGLQGARGLSEIANEVERNVSGPKPPPSAAFLTGAWRLLPRGTLSKNSDVFKRSLNILTLADLHSHDQRLQSVQEFNPKPSPLVDEAWAGVMEALLCFYGREGGESVDSVVAAELSQQRQSKAASKASFTRKNKSYAELVARHIPSSILLEDVTAFAKWLARPDRPKLVSGRSLQLFTDRHQQNRHKAALNALEMIASAIAETKADYSFLPAAADATTGVLLPWSSVTDIGELYRSRPKLLPPSLAVMMHPSAVLEFLHSPESSTLPLVADAKRSTQVGHSYRDDDEGGVTALEAAKRYVAFRTTAAALAKRRRCSSLTWPQWEKKKPWLLPSVGSRSMDTMSSASMGTGDDVVVRIPA